VQRALGKIERAVTRALGAGFTRLGVDDRQQGEADRDHDRHHHQRGHDDRPALTCQRSAPVLHAVVFSDRR